MKANILTKPLTCSPWHYDGDDVVEGCIIMLAHDSDTSIPRVNEQLHGQLSFIILLLRFAWLKAMVVTLGHYCH